MIATAREYIASFPCGPRVPEPCSDDSLRAQLGRAAFYRQSLALDQLLRDAYPNGCTLREAVDWARGLQIRLTHFTPQNRTCWKWSFVIAMRALEPGEHACLDGKTRRLSRGIQAWTGCEMLPDFDSRDEAEAWAEESGILHDSTEID